MLSVKLSIFLSLMMFSTDSRSQTTERLNSALPELLQKILLETPETIRPSHYPSLVKWFEKLKFGMQETVIIENPEFSTSDLSIFGNLEVYDMDLVDFEESCGKIRGRFFWLKAKMKVFDIVLKMTDKLVRRIEKESNPEKLESFFHLMQTLLNRLNEAVELERSIPQRDKVETSYYWKIAKSQIAQSIQSVSNVKITEISPKTFHYPGINWSTTSHLGFEQLEVIQSNLLYSSGGIRLDFVENLRSLCLDQFYFRIEADLHYSFEASEALKKITFRDRPLTLHGHFIENHVNRLQKNTVTIQLLRNLLSQIKDIFNDKTNFQNRFFEFAALVLDLEVILDQCHSPDLNLASGSETSCRSIQLMAKKWIDIRNRTVKNFKDHNITSMKSWPVDETNRTENETRLWMALMMSSAAK